METATKRCTKCGQIKSIDSFYRLSRNTDGLNRQCKSCKKEYEKESRKTQRKADPEGFKKKRHQEYLNGKDKQLEKTRQRKYKEYTPGLFDELYLEQRGRCAICGTHQSELKTALCIEHNHDTNKIRGLLCNRCNIGIMNFKEDAENCLKAYQYLRERS